MYLILKAIKYIYQMIIIVFLKQENVVCVCIGKPNTEKRSEFVKSIQMNENKKKIDAYNNLLKILKVKNKQFEQNVFNDFLEDQNI